MRLIDADALLEVARNHLALFDSCPGKIGLTEKIRRDEIQNSIADILNAPTVEIRPDNCGFENGYYALVDGVWYKMNLKTKWDDAKTIQMPPIKLADAVWHHRGMTHDQA